MVWSMELIFHEVFILIGAASGGSGLQDLHTYLLGLLSGGLHLNSEIVLYMSFLSSAYILDFLRHCCLHILGPSNVMMFYLLWPSDEDKSCYVRVFKIKD